MTRHALVMQPGYVSTALGQVHLRWGGTGPVVVLLHDAPGSSATLDPHLLDALLRTRTVFAPDLVGAGGTSVDDDLAGDLDTQATVIAEALRAVGVSSAPIAGDGAGAAVAARMAELFPDLVTAFVAMSEPYAGSQEPPQLAPPDTSGSHLLRLFDEVRDSFVFRPWWQPRKENRRPCGLPTPAVLHTSLLDTAEHGDAHRRLAAAAGAAWRSAGLVPSAGSDPATTILRLAVGTGQVVIPETANSIGTSRSYVSTSIGAIHLRQSGSSGDSRPVLLLHANPGSGLGLEPMGEALGSSRQTIVWDTPGHGRSVALPEDGSAPTLADTYAPLLVEVLDALGIERCDVYGTHTGAGLATELAILAPERVGAVVLDGVPLFDDQPDLVASVMEHYFVDLVPDTTGSHIRRAWGCTRDMALWWPWFNHTPEGIRDVDAYAPGFMHHVVADMLRSAPYYYRSYQSAWLWKCTQRLGLLKRPVLVGSTPLDPLAAMTPTALTILGQRATEAVFHPLGAPGSVAANAALIADYLDTIDVHT